MAVTAYSLGAAEEVTGSRHILEIDGRSIMIDCGAFQGRRERNQTKKTGNSVFRRIKLKALF